MKRILICVAAVAIIAASAATAAAASGQQLCVGSPGSAVATPVSASTCSPGQTLITLATQSEVSTLQSQVAALQKTLSKVSYSPAGLNGLPTLRITGANLQILSGSGSTEGTVNGLGNLILGYGENPHGFSQAGSHNLVLGDNQEFTSYGGLVAGQYNHAKAPFADIFGYNSTASGQFSSISGGSSNTASGQWSSVGGGFANTSSGDSAMVSGGQNNTASSTGAAVGGGDANTSSGSSATVSGGQHNTASGTGATVSGGYANAATDPNGSILGGCSNLTGPGSNPDAQGYPACEALGIQNNAVAGGMDNTAEGNSASVSGGNSNGATGVYAAWVGGGYANSASGSSATISGGQNNTASGTGAAASGGQYNLASDPFASSVGGSAGLAGGGTPSSSPCNASGIEAILGGFYNTANGRGATVSAGSGNTAFGDFSVVIGGDSEGASGTCGIAPGIVGYLNNC
jgi:hypothetical protein